MRITGTYYADTLVQQLSKALGMPLSSTLLFNYPTVASLSSHLAGLVKGTGQHVGGMVAGSMVGTVMTCAEAAAASPAHVAASTSAWQQA
jgi:hypothetical protein